MRRYSKWEFTNISDTPAWMIVFRYYARKVLPGYNFERDYEKWVEWRKSLLLL